MAMFPRPVEPSKVNQRNRLDPLRCYLSLRRTLEPHWYRRFWLSDPWSRFTISGDLAIAFDGEEEQMLRPLDEIPSAVTFEQTKVLYCLARDCSAAGDIVEIGSDQGKSTIALSFGASNNQNRCAVHAVDPFLAGADMTSSQRSQLFAQNLAKFGARNVTLHTVFSGEYRRERQTPVRLIFIDAAHDYLNSRFDFLAWRELISPGGFLAAHDVDNYAYGPGTRKAFMDCVLRDRRFQLVYHTDNLAVVQAIHPQTNN